MHAEITTVIVERLEEEVQTPVAVSTRNDDKAMFLSACQTDTELPPSIYKQALV